jgi:hypothetical protein
VHVWCLCMCVTQGVRHGAGTFFYADGSRYCGQWEDNVKCGYGVHTLPDGGVSEGMFKQDRLVGALGSS